MRQEILKQWDVIVSFMEMEYSSDFDDISQINDCDLSHGMECLTLDVSVLLQQEVVSLKELEVKRPVKVYFFTPNTILGE